ncbi:hypothetical protein [Rhodovulum sp. FJ3]|uniref:hypothetical protein n=1 Tax=Rhodovulum sp. FJ3 TaxID=3079053 RepID=UPI00293DA36C|nr:hypothetical protein [Rhodovulum sp. FJ3]MDV4167786.1 hypothetical protein [Rhodovulum sp. FJ3]
MEIFRRRLQEAIDASPEYRGKIQKLSRDAGVGDKTVYNMLKAESLDVSKAGPGIFNMARITGLLGVSLDFLVGRAAPPVRAIQSGQGIPAHINASLSAQLLGSDAPLSADKILRLHLKSGGRIEAFEPFLPQCDQYYPPAGDDETLTVKSVGEKSLSALTMGRADKELLQGALNQVDDTSLKARWVDDYRTASRNGTLCTLETLDVQMPNHPTRVRMDFIRCLVGVQGAESDPVVLNFSMLVV